MVAAFHQVVTDFVVAIAVVTSVGAVAAVAEEHRLEDGVRASLLDFPSCCDD